MNPKKLALGAASVLAAGAIIGGGAALASADPTPSASASASGASADRGSASGTAGQGRQMGGTHTDVTGDGPRRSSTPSRQGLDCHHRQGPGRGRVLRRRARRPTALQSYDVSADLATITEGRWPRRRRLPDLRSPVTRRSHRRRHAEDSSATIDTVRKDPDGLDARDDVRWRRDVRVSADLATITQGPGVRAARAVRAGRPPVARPPVGPGPPPMAPRARRRRRCPATDAPARLLASA